MFFFITKSSELGVEEITEHTYSRSLYSVEEALLKLVQQYAKVLA